MVLERKALNTTLHRHEEKFGNTLRVSSLQNTFETFYYFYHELQTVQILENIASSTYITRFNHLLSLMSIPNTKKGILCVVTFFSNKPVEMQNFN